MATPLTKGPCQGKISFTNEGDNDANKLNAAKTQNAVILMIQNCGRYSLFGCNSLGAKLKG